MIQDLSAKFLGEKINELENALFMSESNGLLTLPTFIIRNSQVDEEGNIWFIIPKPTQIREIFLKAMPAKLDYFRKTSAFYLKISGMASIVFNNEEAEAANLSAAFLNSRTEENVFVKLTVEITELIKKTSKQTLNPLSNVGSQMYNWLLSPLFNA